MKTAVILVVCCGLLLLFVLCLRLIRKLTRPLRHFAGAARSVASGDFTTPLPPVGRDRELCELQDSFRFMQESLTGYIEELRQSTAVKERIESELRIASEIQMGMIPKIFPPFPEREDIDLYAELHPAKEVGGDLYDFFIHDGKLYFVIGDVSGKGIPASLFMAVTRSLFRSVATYFDSPDEIIRSMNTSITESNDSNMFVTLLVGILDMASGRLAWCNAGHNPPVVVPPGEEPYFLDVTPNLPAGVLPGFAYRSQQVRLRPGTTLFMYTDGITEAENKAKALYGGAALLAVISDSPRATPEEMTRAVIADVRAHSDGAEQSDDLTVMAVRYTGPAGEPWNRSITLVNETGEIARLAEFIGGIGKELDLSGAQVSALNLALEECVANVILYAYPGKTGQTVTVEACREGKRLVFTVTDSGLPFDPTRAPEADVTLSAAERPVGGLGIHLVRKIMDAVEYRRCDGKNVLILKKNLS